MPKIRKQFKLRKQAKLSKCFRRIGLIKYQRAPAKDLSRFID